MHAHADVRFCASVICALRLLNDTASVMSAQLVAMFVAAVVTCGDKREKVSASCYRNFKRSGKMVLARSRR